MTKKRGKRTVKLIREVDKRHRYIAAVIFVLIALSLVFLQSQEQGTVIETRTEVPSFVDSIRESLGFGIGLQPVQDFVCSDDQRIFVVSGSSNAHGEVYDFDQYGDGRMICYDDLFDSDFDGTNAHDCADDRSNVVIRLSSLSNAHAEIPDASNLDPNYQDVCFGDLDCRSTVGECDGDEAEIIRLTSNSNSHMQIGSGDDSYDIRVCCSSNAQPVETECVLSNLHWVGPLSVVHGTPVELGYEGANCELDEQIRFTVIEDSLINTPMDSSPGIREFGESVIWIAEYRDDFGTNPEYFFEAEVLSTGEVYRSSTSSSLELEVTELIIPASCGNGEIDEGEVCDNGEQNGEPNNCNADCSGQTVPICGNNVREEGEVCDGTDSSSCVPGTVCSSCLCEPINPGAICGNGICDSQETCASCSSDCGFCPENCGDGNIGEGEQCESNSDCSNNEICSGCQCIDDGPMCGDGIINGNEQCEGDNLDGMDCVDIGFDAGELACNPPGVSQGCTYDVSGCFDFAPPPTCGDNSCDSGENCNNCNVDCGICVDPNQCNSDQRIMKISSNTNAHVSAWNSDNDYKVDVCYNDLFVEEYGGSDSHDCSDGNIVLRISGGDNSHVEDPGLESLGYQDLCFGDLDCSIREGSCETDEAPVIKMHDLSNSHVERINENNYDLVLCCSSQSSSPRDQLCGNGIKDGNEECDQEDFGEETCASQGFVSGELSCSNLCRIETVNCIGECRFVQASWSVNEAGPGDSITLSVETADCSVGEEVSFAIYDRDDASAHDGIRIGDNVLSGTVNSVGIASAVWTITQEDVDAAGGDSEYANGHAEVYFEAILNSKTDVRIESDEIDLLRFRVEGDPSCGDGNVDSGEECDDGNSNSEDGCSANCRLEICGDAIVQRGLGEECEGTSQRSCTATNGYPGTQTCINPGAANNECKFGACVSTGICGDGIHHSSVEVCDDGNENGQPGKCNVECNGFVTPQCGNDAKEGSESCDGTDSLLCPGQCSATCTCPTGTSIPPTIDILNPENGDVIEIPGETTDLTVNFNTINWSISGRNSSHVRFGITNMPGITNSDEFIFYNGNENVVELNGQATSFAAWIGANSLRFNDVTLGEHEISASLFDSSNKLLNPEASTSVSFVIERIPEETGPAPTPGFVWVETIILEPAQFNNGHSEVLGPGSRVRFDVGFLNTFVGIRSISGNSAIVHIENVGDLSFTIGQTERVDADLDGDFDYEIKVLSISGDEVLLEVMKITRDLPAEISDPPRKYGALFYWLLVFLIGMAILAVVVLMLQKNKKRPSGKVGPSLKSSFGHKPSRVPSRFARPRSALSTTHRRPPQRLSRPGSRAPPRSPRK